MRTNPFYTILYNAALKVYKIAMKSEAAWTAVLQMTYFNYGVSRYIRLPPIFAAVPECRESSVTAA